MHVLGQFNLGGHFKYISKWMELNATSIFKGLLHPEVAQGTISLAGFLAGEDSGAHAWDRRRVMALMRRSSVMARFQLQEEEEEEKEDPFLQEFKRTAKYPMEKNNSGPAIANM